MVQATATGTGVPFHVQAADGTPIEAILHPAPSGAARSAVLILHGRRDRLADRGGGFGTPRLYRDLVTATGEAGMDAVRMDFRAKEREDADWARPPEEAFREMTDDVLRVLTHLRNDRGLTQIHLVGFCLGGLVALRLLAAGAPVSRYALVSVPPVGDARAVAQGYLAKLLRPDTWRRLARGAVNLRFIAGRFRRHLGGRAVPRRVAGRAALLFVLAGRDTHRDAALASYGAWSRRVGLPASFHVIDGADHNFFFNPGRRTLLDRLTAFLTDPAA